MLKNIKNRKSDGFTIIEVMIVLAIAGLILLIVFLAVPALQRSARNTQAKNDAAQIAAGVANFISNNGGSIPNEIASNSTSSTGSLVIGAGGTGNTETAKLGTFSAGTTTTLGTTAGTIAIVGKSTTFTPTLGAPGTGGTPTAVGTGGALIVTGEGCNDTNNGGGTPSSRTAAVFYVTESGSGNGNLQCLEQ